MLYVYRIVVYIICVLLDTFSTDLYPVFVDSVNKSVDNPQLSTVLLFHFHSFTLIPRPSSGSILSGILLILYWGPRKPFIQNLIFIIFYIS